MFSYTKSWLLPRSADPDKGRGGKPFLLLFQANKKAVGAH
jgi:hypothetical protein